MEVSRITSRLSFRADSTPAVTTSNVTLEPAPAEKKSHTGLIVGGVVLAAALAGYAIYRRKSPKAVADEAKIVKTTKEMDETSKQYQKKIKEFEEEQVKTNKEMKAIIQNVNGATQKTAHKVKRATASTMDKIVNDLEAFWSKHLPNKKNIGNKIKIENGRTIETKAFKLRLNKEDGNVLISTLRDKDNKIISKVLTPADGTDSTILHFAFDKKGNPTKVNIYGKEVFSLKWSDKEILIEDKRTKNNIWTISYDKSHKLTSIKVGENHTFKPIYKDTDKICGFKQYKKGILYKTIKQTDENYDEMTRIHNKYLTAPKIFAKLKDAETKAAYEEFLELFTKF